MVASPNEADSRVKYAGGRWLDPWRVFWHLHSNKLHQRRQHLPPFNVDIQQHVLPNTTFIWSSCSYFVKILHWSWRSCCIVSCEDIAVLLMPYLRRRWRTEWTRLEKERVEILWSDQDVQLNFFVGGSGPTPPEWTVFRPTVTTLQVWLWRSLWLLWLWCCGGCGGGLHLRTWTVSIRFQY